MGNRRMRKKKPNEQLCNLKRIPHRKIHKLEIIVPRLDLPMPRDLPRIAMTIRRLDGIGAGCALGANLEGDQPLPREVSDGKSGN